MVHCSFDQIVEAGKGIGLAAEITVPIDGAASAAPRVPLITHINYSIGTLAPSALVVFSRSFLLFSTRSPWA